MSSLREVKDRIASVRSTLKITSAMKLVASSKLRRLQGRAEALRPYADALSAILAAVPRGVLNTDSSVSGPAPLPPACARTEEEGSAGRPLLIVFGGNASMCGAYNANVIKHALEEMRAAAPGTELWVCGKRVAQALEKSGFKPSKTFHSLASAPSREEAYAFSAQLREDFFENGLYSSVRLLYTGFLSAGKQKTLVEAFLPWSGASSGAASLSAPAATAASSGFAPRPGVVSQATAAPRPGADKGSSVSSETSEYIIEPSAPELLSDLIPEVLDLRLYSAALEAAASEHASRMAAMQAATDNATELLAALTLEYNKGRQQKITSEILDLVSGSL